LTLMTMRIVSTSRRADEIAVRVSAESDMDFGATRCLDTKPSTLSS
jgi:hypothetical protein